MANLLSCAHPDLAVLALCCWQPAYKCDELTHKSNWGISCRMCVCSLLPAHMRPLSRTQRFLLPRQSVDDALSVHSPPTLAQRSIIGTAYFLLAAYVLYLILVQMGLVSSLREA